jgi:hypothetical protein
MKKVNPDTEVQSPGLAGADSRASDVSRWKPPTERTCDHPDFSRCASGASPFTFIFDREMYIKPTSAQVAKYKRDKTIVEASCGRMILLDYEIGGTNPTFTKADVQAAIELVLKANPDLEFHQSWNGEGAYTLSVGCRMRSVAPAGR